MHETFSPLYRDLYSGLETGKLGGQHIGTDFAGAAKKYIDTARSKALAGGQVVTGYRPLEYTPYRSDETQTINVPIFGRDPAKAEEDLRTEQARLAGIQKKIFDRQQADIAAGLKLIQDEKSAVSKMTQEYSDMLIAEADRKKAAEEQAKRELQIQRANTAMANRSGALQIQGASTTPRVGGTQQFRRRVIQQGTVSPYKGLSTIQSRMVNL